MGTSMAEPKSESHSCCKKTQQRKTLLSYAAGAIAAFLACLCCSLPLIPIMLGLSGFVILEPDKAPSAFRHIGSSDTFWKSNLHLA